MQTATLTAVLGSMLLAGLAGSLHCIGMCGPILLGFAQVFERASLTVNGEPVAAEDAGKLRRRRLLLRDFSCYHAGRLWTYAMLGALAGLVGQQARQGSTYLGWQRPAAIAVCALVIVSGVWLLGWLPIVKVDALASGCGFKRWGGSEWFTALRDGRGALPRLLLGAVMGLLPCGLVYAMLAAAAALGSPFWGAMGMLAFGIGTLPSLTAVVAVNRFIPKAWRLHGTRIAGAVVIVMGGLMLARTLAVSPGSWSAPPSCPFCAPESVAPAHAEGR